MPCLDGGCGNGGPGIGAAGDVVDITVNRGCTTVDCWLQHYIIEKKLLCLLGLCDAETRRAFRYLREAECLLRRLWLADQRRVFAEGATDFDGAQAIQGRYNLNNGAFQAFPEGAAGGADDVFGGIYRF